VNRLNFILFTSVKPPFLIIGISANQRTRKLCGWCFGSQSKATELTF